MKTVWIVLVGLILIGPAIDANSADVGYGSVSPDIILTMADYAAERTNSSPWKLIYPEDVLDPTGDPLVPGIPNEAYDPFWLEARPEMPASAPLEYYSGVYSNPIFGTVSVVSGREGLSVTFESGIRLTVRHYGADTFATEHSDPSFGYLKLDFLVSDGNGISSFLVSFENSPDEFLFVR
ncbi:MAG TPA: DUF3471 domain-containing protein [Candidatus Krumholzibacterium sp.]|nr:DUF3471 domain-containing protein [Candidatus Krumholzibacterium sp.]